LHQLSDEAHTVDNTIEFEKFFDVRSSQRCWTVYSVGWQKAIDWLSVRMTSN